MAANPRTSGAMTEYVIAMMISYVEVKLKGRLTDNRDIGKDGKNTAPRDSA